MKFGLLGHPLGHSMSPFIHGRLMSIKNLSANYDLYDIPPERLGESRDRLFALDGFNITIPYKQEIIKYLDCLDDTAARYNSVNVVRTGGKNIGYNTDVIGFLKSVQHLGASLGGKTLMLGCGGVARMMGAETVAAGGDLTIAVRDPDGQKVKDLVNMLSCINSGAHISVADINKVGGKFDIMLNATSVGMYPNINSSPASEETVAGCKYVFDAVYNPEDTLLAKYAAKHNVKCMTGMEMLVRQAAEAQTIWNGFEFDDGEIMALVSQANEEMKKR